MRRLLLATALAAVTTAAAAQTAPERLAFDVLRDGEQVGTHEITLDRRADGTDVRIRTDVAVKVAFFTAYRFEHAGHEAWSRGHLAAMDTSTNDDGTRHELHVVARDARPPDGGRWARRNPSRIERRPRGVSSRLLPPRRVP